jgi:uncharacterized protein
LRQSSANRAEIARLYETLESQLQTVHQTLSDAGFAPNEIEMGAIDYHHHSYRDMNQQVVEEIHQLSGTLAIETAQVEKVAKARPAIAALVLQGIMLESQTPSYRFTSLNDIKNDMLKEATANARLSAAEFADNAGAKVGGIQQARQGGFQIVDAGEEYGSSQKLEKDVRVVTTISFTLE